MRVKWLVGMLVAAFLPSAAVGSVPPSNWPPPSFEGPGLLCGEGFSLILQRSEKAVDGLPTNGYTPVYVDSHGGRFALISYWGGEPKTEKKKLESRALGDVYLVKRTLMDLAAGVPQMRRYWFEPKLGKPFGLDFFAAVPGPGGWAEFPPSAYASVLQRIAFAPPGAQDGCLTSKP